MNSPEVVPATSAWGFVFWELASGLSEQCANVVPLTGGFEEQSIGLYCVLFLFLSGDVSTKPGPTIHWKHPCTTWQKPVKNNQAGLKCDQCDARTHLRCLPDAIRRYASRKKNTTASQAQTKTDHCYQCQLPTFSDSFFSTTSAESEITDDEPDHANVFDEIRNRRPTDMILKYQQPGTQSD